jgi:predicted small secreted protein
MISFGLVACNTMRGFGQDVERGGEKVQGAATKSQQGSSSSGSSSSRPSTTDNR